MGSAPPLLASPTSACAPRPAYTPPRVHPLSCLHLLFVPPFCVHPSSCLHHPSACTPPPACTSIPACNPPPACTRLLLAPPGVAECLPTLSAVQHLQPLPSPRIRGRGPLIDGAGPAPSPSLGRRRKRTAPWRFLAAPRSRCLRLWFPRNCGLAAAAHLHRNTGNVLPASASQRRGGCGLGFRRSRGREARPGRW